MAGGKGTRLAPLTAGRPKPMVPVLNRPVVEHLIRLLARHGICEIMLTTHYLPQQIQDALGTGAELGVDLSYVVEEAPLGTAGSVKQLQGQLKETFLVLSGDALTDLPLSAAIEAHRRSGALATLVVTEVDDPCRYGIVDHQGDGRIVRFLEKPRPDQVFSRTVNTGIYVMEPEALDPCPPDEAFDFSRDLFPRLLQRKAPLYAVKADGYWSDIGDCGQYIRSQLDALEQKVRLETLPPTSRPGVWIEPGARVHAKAQLVPPVMIGNGATVEARARVGPGAVLGPGCLVERGAVVEGAVIWEESRIGSDTTVVGAALGRRVELGSRSRVGEGAIVGDHVRLKAGSVVEAGGRVPAAPALSPRLVGRAGADR